MTMNMTMKSLPHNVVYIKKVGHRRFVAAWQLNDEQYIFSENPDKATAGWEKKAVEYLENAMRSLGYSIPNGVNWEIKQVPKEPVTPRSDKDAWMKAWQNAKAWAMHTLNDGNNNGRLDAEKFGIFRKTVISLMRKADCVSPWTDIDPNESGYTWAMEAGLKDDPTANIAYPGVGENRRYKDINGLERYSDGELVQKEMFTNLQKDPPPVEEVGEDYTYGYGTPQQMEYSYAQAQYFAEVAEKYGLDEDTQELWSMVGFLLALRELGLPAHLWYVQKVNESNWSYLLHQNIEDLRTILKSA